MLLVEAIVTNAVSLTSDPLSNSGIGLRDSENEIAVAKVESSYIPRLIYINKGYSTGEEGRSTRS